MKYLIIGSKGQLGKEFVKIFNLYSYDFFAFDIDQIDINDYTKTKEIISYVKPNIVINCSAYNDVDNAELNPELAMTTNAYSVKNLAQICEQKNIFLIHYSSDYVFEGNKNYYKYDENDIPNPINNYGKSKLLGEEYIKETTNKYLIFRVSWVYGNGTQNFIYKFLNWSKKNKILRITNDEISIPTSTTLIANYTIKSINQGLSGLFHLTNTGFASRYDWALVITKLFKLQNKIEQCSINEFNLPAKRPFFSAMNNTKISQNINITTKDWQDDFVEFVTNEYNAFC